MGRKLVIVESPAKANTIEKYLGKSEYQVRATMGHLRDLPKSQFGVSPEEGFTPRYITVRGKTALVKELSDLAQKSERVYLATDPDREGEAIAWHLATLLSLPPDKPCRIEFNEITKPAVIEAIKHARAVDMDKVNAQQARRILDRIVGYKLSPLLWKKVRRGLSAGRVQSVAVRLICDREREIEAFRIEEYWQIHAKLSKHPGEPVFTAELISIDGKKAVLGTAEQSAKIQAELEKSPCRVANVKRRDRQRKPYPPFITSTLQQDASHRLGFSAKKTMVLAQQLYESGYITYMRTDSTRVASQAQSETRELVLQTWGDQYLPATAPRYAKKSSQDAHEAIRPTEVGNLPEKLSSTLSHDQSRLYSLIWKRFVASQMSPAVYDTVTVDISAGRFALRASGSLLRFKGFLVVYTDANEKDTEEDNETTLPALSEHDPLTTESVEASQHFTEPPPRFTEAALIKILEEKGIGRPSTYAPTIDTIQERGYVIKNEKKFKPTPLGFVVVDLLKDHFTEIIDVDFTANMERRLDEVAQGSVDWRNLLAEFYTPFINKIALVEKEADRRTVPAELSDEVCEKCGAPMAIKRGRFGTFLGCSNFPECRNTKPLVKDVGVPCPVCGNPVVERKGRSGKTFYGCREYPKCAFVSWLKPSTEKCPTCGSFMVVRQLRGRDPVLECGDAKCPSKLSRQKTVADESAPVKKKAAPKVAVKAAAGGSDAKTRLTVAKKAAKKTPARAAAAKAKTKTK